MAFTRKAVREFAGLTGRGRTPNSAIEHYLRAHPSEARALARQAGVPVADKGRLSDDTIAALVKRA